MMRDIERSRGELIHDSNLRRRGKNPRILSRRLLSKTYPVSSPKVGIVKVVEILRYDFIDRQQRACLRLSVRWQITCSQCLFQLLEHCVSYLPSIFIGMGFH